MPSASAYQRFLASTVITYDQWHDGEGYDLAALSKMSDAERGRVQAMMIQRPIEWREIEVLEALDSAGSWQAIEQVFARAAEVDTRLAAAAALDRRGALNPPIDEVIAEAILRLETIQGGSTRALLMAESHPTEPVKRALLRASGRKNEIAMHCAALLCFLSGKAKEPFDWELRPLFLRLAPDNEESDRMAAFREVCGLAGMTAPGQGGADSTD
jgi:hypothetical protein